ncbi:MAG TPA: diguanylate cyclase [Rhodocyclaceae bacterium]|nr:diguanylate cyclase [Rhodocyclaceae bacterium]
MTRPLDIDKFEQLRISGELPSPRGVALAIIKLTAQHDVSLTELGRVVSGDPAFVGRLIKAANGLIAMNRRSVSSANEALMILGLPAVRTMALGFSLLSNYRSGMCRSFDYNRFWSYSLALAVAMQVVTQRTRIAAADEMFSLGLLTRVGELALATVYAEDYSKVIDRAGRDPQVDLQALEHDVFAMTHTELGMAMLRDWGLPPIFVEVAGQFERVDADVVARGGRLQRLALQLALARALADMCLGPAKKRSGLLHVVFGKALEAEVEQADVLVDCDRIISQWLDWGKLLQLDMPERFSVNDLVSEAPTTWPEEVTVEVPAPARPVLGAAEPGRAPASQDALRALIVDAEVGERGKAVDVARALGLETVEAGDANQGLEKALDVLPNLVVIATATPADLEFIRSMRRIRVGRSIYVLAIAPQAEVDMLLSAFDAGADDVTAAPFSKRLLGARLRSGIRVVGLQRELKQEREELRRFAAELAVTNRRLKEAAVTDFLTGFKNRRYADERLDQAWIASMRDGSPLSCMVVDFDGLKSINDGYGHAVGDAALKVAAEALKAQLRRQEIICRVGGDEFMLICPNTTVDDALICAERLRRAVAARRLSVRSAELELSVSIGVATRDSHVRDAEALIRLADEGAYAAKEQGRNRVVAMQRRKT